MFYQSRMRILPSINKQDACSTLNQQAGCVFYPPEQAGCLGHRFGH
ncbi:MAG: hypothetical protein ACPGWR_30775 [Ardenticatenaceae bacterium]